MIISELMEILERAQDNLGDVEVYGWDSGDGSIKTFKINCVNSEGDHIELTQ